MIVLLDAGPLGVITNPKTSPENEKCKAWVSAMAFAGARIVIPEIADYEVRRELIRGDKLKGISRLDALRAILAYEPITTAVMRRAAEFWASARKQGRQATDDSALDADMILAAQAVELAPEDQNTMIATMNPRRLALFADAREWSQIHP